MMVHPPSKYHSNRDIFSTPQCIGNQWLLVPQILQIHGLIACNFVLSSFFRPNDMAKRLTYTVTKSQWYWYDPCVTPALSRFRWVGNLLTINLCSISIFGKILVTGLLQFLSKNLNCTKNSSQNLNWRRRTTAPSTQAIIDYHTCPWSTENHLCLVAWVNTYSNAQSQSKFRGRRIDRSPMHSKWFRQASRLSQY